MKQRDQRVDSQNRSLHYVQVYAVRDMVDFFQQSTAPPPRDEWSVYDILPTTSDYQVLKDNFSILIARILVEHTPYFREDFKGLVVNHIQHPYSSLMANASEVVSDSIVDRNNVNYTTCNVVHPILTDRISDSMHWLAGNTSCCV